MNTFWLLAVIALFTTVGIYEKCLPELYTYDLLTFIHFGLNFIMPHSGVFIETAVILLMWASLIYMIIIWIYVMSHVLLSGWPDVHPSYVTKTLALNITCRLFNQFFHTCHAGRHHWCLPLYTTFTDLRPCLDATRSLWNKTCQLQFLPHISFDREEIELVTKQFKLNILRLLLSKIFFETMGITAVLLIA